MGNNHGKPHSAHREILQKATQLDPRVETAFRNMGQGSPLTFKHFEDAFGFDLASSLWNYLSEEKSKDMSLSLEEFSKHAASLMGASTQIYSKILLPQFHPVKVCCESAGAGAIHGDEEFISLFWGLPDMISWIQAHCPNFYRAVQDRVLKKFLDYELQERDFSSDILTPMQMWFVQASLPQVYFSSENAMASSHWTPLYTSAMQGISVNRFEANVFDYRGPTVSIFQLTDKRIVVIATDHEWRHRTSRFGGPHTTFMEISPNLLHLNSDTMNSIYCNFQIRSAVFGLSFKNMVQIDKEFSNIRAIEVWGCAGSSTLADQQKLKQWQNQQAERHKKVPLPGNWDDNPDKSILEMAGFQFSNERKLMEMEAQAQARK